jgi:hypothetical protein
MIDRAWFITKGASTARSCGDRQKGSLRITGRSVSIHGGLSVTRRRGSVVELLVQVEHACGSCPMSPVRSASSRWCRGCVP